MEQMSQEQSQQQNQKVAVKNPQSPQPQMQTSVQPNPAPAQTVVEQPVGENNSKWWVWLVVGIVVLVVLAGVYFLLF